VSFRFDESEFRERAAGRLHATPTAKTEASDDDLNPQARAIDPAKLVQPAAVLVPLVTRPHGLNILFTRRTEHLSRHAGQVAFPGGRIDARDTGPVAAALRETSEETGIAPGFVEPLGFLDTYLTSTSYRVTPVVAMLRPGFALTPDAGEVAEVFEVPLAFLMDPARHERHARLWQGRQRFYYAMPFEGRYIWGATAGMVRNLYARMYA
jgi:8-oxo-dGTP pyrophosphatase MutT (NUDIX family)